jgi:hypothetical protein
MQKRGLDVGLASTLCSPGSFKDQLIAANAATTVVTVFPADN